MIRALLMIAVAGFVLSVASISAAVAIGGPDFVARSGWNIASNHSHWDWDDDDDDDVRSRWGADTTRTLAWSGEHSLDVELAVMQVLYEGTKDPKYRPAPLLVEMLEAGYLGRKSGRGFFEYAI